MARTDNLTNFLNDVATAIKSKLDDSTAIPASQFDTKIMSIQTRGNYETRTVNVISNGSQTITPDQGYDALSSIVINTQVPIPQLQTKSYEFTDNATITLSPEQGYDGFSSISLTIAVPGSTINNQNKTITPTTSQQVISADQGYTGLGDVTVNAVTSSIDQNITASNIKDGVTILGVEGTYEGSGQQINNQDKTITQNGTYQADQGYTGLGEVIVNVSGDYSGTITPEEYEDAVETSEQILGAIEPVIYDKVSFNDSGYIPTNIKLNQDSEVVCKFKSLSDLDSTIAKLFGIRTRDYENTSKAHNKNMFRVSSYNGGQFGFGTNEYNFGNIYNIYKKDNIITMKFNRTGVYRYDEENEEWVTILSITDTIDNFITDLPIDIVGGCEYTINKPNTEDAVSHTTRTALSLYYLQIKENNTLIHDLVPCNYRSEIGLWDNVTSEFIPAYYKTPSLQNE